MFCWRCVVGGIASILLGGFVWRALSCERGGDLSELCACAAAACHVEQQH
jgi:hypothetical protein